MYGFAKLQGDKIALYDPDLDDGDEDWNSGLKWGHGMIRRMVNLRTYNPNLTTMISLGGWNEGSDKYSMMVRDPAKRKVFIQSVLNLLAEFDLDGLDLDWYDDDSIFTLINLISLFREYPAMQASGDSDRKPGRTEDKEDYINLLRELHEAFRPHGYALSAAVSAGKPTIDRAYNIPEMSKYLDFINLMSYDYHGGWENHTGHNAPLNSYNNANELDKEFTVTYSVEYWLNHGILGIPLYGRTFTLASSDHGIGAPAIGKGGASGTITRTIGMLGYNEICTMIKQGWQLYRDEVERIPYAVHANQWIGYDDRESINEKLNLLMKKNLGGAMIWSIDTDDFVGNCVGIKYPLLRSISKKLNNIDGPDPDIKRYHYHTSTAHPHTTVTHHDHETTKHLTTRPHHDQTSTTTTTTMKPHGKFQCHQAGFFADPENPRKFHQCVDFGSYLKDYEFMCGDGTHYDERLHVCVR
ncbi:mite allergen-like protein (Chitinase-like) [Euroglyphus maynei]|uniref:Mite allergen-like protein (Chitinase-like) n=1 Tax=Euroglyphus maynei TaxID=6958 RepID=A0A1Y3BV98_EURMA|nr:mite allergen-like protein (Chitinase-like) [Euroglyphus maynei]